MSSDSQQLQEDLAEAKAEIELRLHARLAGLAPGRLVSEELIADRRLEAAAELKR
jgi:hypothetical protein